MKCKHCDGTGNVIFYDSEVESTDIEKCIHCNGKGVVEPLTNEEWLKSKDTADLAEWIYNAMFNKSCQEDVEDGSYMQTITKKDYIEKWLKQPHTPFS